MAKVKYTKELLEENIKDCYSFAELCRRLGLKPEGSNPKTVRSKLEQFGVDYSHFTGKGWSKGKNVTCNPGKDLDDIMVENSTYQSYKLCQRLLKEGRKEHKCENCGLTEWLDNQVPIELHHINGISTDNRFENLQILCSNCHAQTDNYRAKNK